MFNENLIENKMVSLPHIPLTPDVLENIIGLEAVMEYMDVDDVEELKEWMIENECTTLDMLVDVLKSVACVCGACESRLADIDDEVCLQCMEEIDWDSFLLEE